jgi:hypothetical protein
MDIVNEADGEEQGLWETSDSEAKLGIVIPAKAGIQQ